MDTDYEDAYNRAAQGLPADPTRMESSGKYRYGYAMGYASRLSSADRSAWTKFIAENLPVVVLPE